MNIRPTDLPGVMIVEPEVLGDKRGWFLENWRRERFAEAGIAALFEQVNTSRSGHGVLRGLHYQWPEPQGKLVWVTEGRVLDVAVDIRPESAGFSDWAAVELSAENHRQLWVPEGFAHGFQVLSLQATVCYLCTRPYQAEHDRAIAWNDPDIGIEWPLQPGGLSEKDARAPRLQSIPRERLPEFDSPQMNADEKR